MKENAFLVFFLALQSFRPVSIPIYHYYILPGIRHKEMMDKMDLIID